MTIDHKNKPSRQTQQDIVCQEFGDNILACPFSVRMHFVDVQQ